MIKRSSIEVGQKYIAYKPDTGAISKPGEIISVMKDDDGRLTGFSIKEYTNDVVFVGDDQDINIFCVISHLVE